VLLNWPPPDHLWIGTKSRHVLPTQRVTNARASIPAEMRACARAAYQRRSSNANSLRGQNSAGFPEIYTSVQRDISRRHF
jgi:hypothetical protein